MVENGPLQDVALPSFVFAFQEREREEKKRPKRDHEEWRGTRGRERKKERELSFQSQGQFSSRGRTEKANFTMEVIPGRGEKIVLSKEEVTWVHFFAKCVGMGRKEKQIDLSVDALTKTDKKFKCSFCHQSDMQVNSEQNKTYIFLCWKTNLCEIAFSQRYKHVTDDQQTVKSLEQTSPLDVV